MTSVESIDASIVNSAWLLGTAAIAIIISLLQAWIVSFIYYLDVKFLKVVFPAPHQLIRSHVDYCTMAGLLGLFYVSVQSLDIVLPNVIIVLICLGALYNPIGFVLLAMKSPEAAREKPSLVAGLVICTGFLPLTIGFGYTACVILSKTI